MRTWLTAHWAVAGLWVLFLSAVDFALMGVDKWKAKRDAWRIPELTLWAFALLGGAPGGYLGMRCFRHKTRHWYFKFGFPALAVLDLTALVWLVLGGVRRFSVCGSAFGAGAGPLDVTGWIKISP